MIQIGAIQTWIAIILAYIAPSQSIMFSPGSLGSKVELTSLSWTEQWKKKWLSRVGDEILPSYVGDYFINHDISIPASLLNSQDSMESKGPGCFSWLNWGFHYSKWLWWDQAFGNKICEAPWFGPKASRLQEVWKWHDFKRISRVVWLRFLKVQGGDMCGMIYWYILSTW